MSCLYQEAYGSVPVPSSLRLSMFVVIIALLENMVLVKIIYFVVISSYLILCISSVLNIWHTIFQIVWVLLFTFCVWGNFLSGRLSELPELTFQKSGSQMLKRNVQCCFMYHLLPVSCFSNSNSCRNNANLNLGNQFNVFHFMFSYFSMGHNMFKFCLS